MRGGTQSQFQMKARQTEDSRNVRPERGRGPVENNGEEGISSRMWGGKIRRSVGIIRQNKILE